MYTQHHTPINIHYAHVVRVYIHTFKHQYTGTYVHDHTLVCIYTMSHILIHIYNAYLHAHTILNIHTHTEYTASYTCPHIYLWANTAGISWQLILHPVQKQGLPGPKPQQKGSAIAYTQSLEASNKLPGDVLLPNKRILHTWGTLPELKQHHAISASQHHLAQCWRLSSKSPFFFMPATSHP